MQTKSIRLPWLYGWNGWRGTNNWQSSPASKLAHQKQQREAGEDILAPIHFAVTLQLPRASLSFSGIGFLASPMHLSPLFPAARQRDGQWGDNVLRCEIGNHPYRHGLISSISWPNFDGVPSSLCPVLVGCRTVGRAFYHGWLSRRFMAHSSPTYSHINTQRRVLIYIQCTAGLKLVSATCLPKRLVSQHNMYALFSCHIVAEIRSHFYLNFHINFNQLLLKNH